MCEEFYFLFGFNYKKGEADTSKFDSGCESKKMTLVRPLIRWSVFRQVWPNDRIPLLLSFWLNQLIPISSELRCSGSWRAGVMTAISVEIEEGADLFKIWKESERMKRFSRSIKIIGSSQISGYYYTAHEMRWTTSSPPFFQQVRIFLWRMCLV